MLFRSISGGSSSSGYIYQRAITIDHTQVPNTDQTNFPVLVSVTDPLFKSVGNGGHVVNPSGYDIVFASDAACSSILNFEIERWKPVNGEVIAWVQIPLLSHTSDTALYICYGNSSVTTNQNNPTATWDGTYDMVLHLPNGVTLSANDSTSNANNASITTATAAGGEIDGAAGFNGSASIDVASFNPSISTSSDFTMSAWVYPTSLSSSGWNQILDTRASSSNTPIRIGADNQELRCQVETPSSNVAYVALATNPVSEWDYVTCTFSTSMHVLTGYLNGTQIGTATVTGDTSSTLLSLGRDPSYSGETYSGLIDEVHVSNVVRSADWIAAEFSNQSSSATFLSLGRENPPTN